MAFKTKKISQNNLIISISKEALGNRSFKGRINLKSLNVFKTSKDRPIVVIVVTFVLHENIL